MAALDDILTTCKNVVTAISQAAATYLNVQGLKNSGSITAATMIKSGSGRITTVIVTTAGAAGLIYDSTSTTSPTVPIFVVPATLGIYVLNMPVSFGIVAVPGAGQAFVVSYS